MGSAVSDMTRRPRVPETGNDRDNQSGRWISPPSSQRSIGEQADDREERNCRANTTERAIAAQRPTTQHRPNASLCAGKQWRHNEGCGGNKSRCDVAVRPSACGELPHRPDGEKESNDRPSPTNRLIRYV